MKIIRLNEVNSTQSYLKEYIQKNINELIYMTSYNKRVTHLVLLSVVALDVCLMCLFIDSHGDVVMAS